MDRFAGVTLDQYDDGGATLKEKFASADNLPAFIKESEFRPKESLNHRDFALVAVDGPNVLQKYACFDAGSTALSTIYFMEHGRHKLPPSAVKMAASNLTMACLANDLVPPADMVKAAGFEKLAGIVTPGGPEVGKSIDQMKGTQSAIETAVPALKAMPGAPEPSSSNPEGGQPKVAAPMQMGGMPMGGGGNGQLMGAQPAPQQTPQKPPPGPIAEAAQGIAAVLKASKEPPSPPPAEAVDISGQEPVPKMAARSTNPDDYAVSLEDGRLLYPIDNWDNVKRAEAYWIEHRRDMRPELRRQFAVKLASRADQMGVSLDGMVKEAGVQTYAGNGHLRASLAMRKVAFPKGSLQQIFLDDLFKEKTAGLHPEVYAEVLRRFDIEEGLDKGWDHVMLDPYESTFAKTADVVWEDGADRVTAQQLHALAQNHSGDLQVKFTDGFVAGFEKDPIGIFNSMPLPQKRILARLADDMAHQGGSEGQVPLTVSNKANEEKTES